MNTSAPVLCGFHGNVINQTCICEPGYGPPGPCVDLFFWDSTEYVVFTMFFVVAFTSVAVVSIYETLYALYRKEKFPSMFFASRLATFGLGLGSEFV